MFMIYCLAFYLVWNYLFTKHMNNIYINACLLETVPIYPLIKTPMWNKFFLPQGFLCIPKYI